MPLRPACPNEGKGVQAEASSQGQPPALPATGSHAEGLGEVSGASGQWRRQDQLARPPQPSVTSRSRAAVLNCFQQDKKAQQP